MSGLAQYLGGSRIGRKGIPSEDSRAMYRPTVELVRAIVEQMNPAKCDVAIVYSMNRYAEICRIGGETVLIYDQYVGQAISSFMRILTWSGSPVGSARAFARIYGEQAVLAGDPAGALAGAFMFDQASAHWQLPHVTSDPKVKLQVQLQEMFIFGHEYCHLMMASSDEFRMSRQKIGEMLLEPEVVPDERELYEAFVARYPSEAEGGYDQWLSSFRERDKVIFENAAALREELSCDDFALHVTLIACRLLGVEPRFGFEAAFLALRNIRALAYIREAANPRQFGMTGAFGLGVRMLQARQHKLRSGFRLAAAAHGLEGELEGFLLDLMDLSDRHDNQVDNPLLFNIIPTLDTVRAEIVANNPELGLGAALEFVEAHGWDFYSNKLEYFII